MPKADVTASVRINRANIDREVSRVGRAAVNETTREIAREARRIVPVRTGYTRSTIEAHTARARYGRGYISGQVTAGGAAKYLQEGTRPHVIRARRAKALHFHWLGREVFFASVNHPGTAPRPFMTIAAATVSARGRARRG